LVDDSKEGQDAEVKRIRQEDLDAVSGLREGDQAGLEDVLARLLPDTGIGKIEQGLQPDAS
jgi:hypothetical protein